MGTRLFASARVSRDGGENVRRTRSVVVTGASAGAGRAIALYFGTKGWRVALLARNRERLDSARDEIRARGGEALVVPADTSDADAVFAARDAVLATWGGI